MSELDLDAIRERVSRICCSHWQTGQSWAGDGAVLNQDGHPVAVVGDGEDAANDAEFIAHARQDVPRLIAEVARLREENREQYLKGHAAGFAAAQTQDPWA